MSETNEPVTDRIEAIRERYSAEDGWFYHDMAWLISEVDRLRAQDYGPGLSQAEARALAPVAPDAEPGGA